MSDKAKLYRIEWTGFCCVLATSPEDAMMAAEIAIAKDQDEARLEPGSPTEIEAEADIPGGWWNCVPWTSADARWRSIPGKAMVDLVRDGDFA